MAQNALFHPGQALAKAFGAGFDEGFNPGFEQAAQGGDIVAQDKDKLQANGGQREKVAYTDKYYFVFWIKLRKTEPNNTIARHI